MIILKKRSLKSFNKIIQYNFILLYQYVRKILYTDNIIVTGGCVIQFLSLKHKLKIKNLKTFDIDIVCKNSSKLYYNIKQYNKQFKNIIFVKKFKSFKYKNLQVQQIRKEINDHIIFKHVSLYDDYQRRDFSVNGMYFFFKKQNFLFFNNNIIDLLNRKINIINKKIFLKDFTVIIRYCNMLKKNFKHNIELENFLRTDMLYFSVVEQFNKNFFLRKRLKYEKKKCFIYIIEKQLHKKFKVINFLLKNKINK